MDKRILATNLDILESLLRDLETFKRTTGEILPLLKEHGEEKLAIIFESALSFFEEKFGEDNGRVEELALHEINFFQSQIANLNVWIRTWTIDLGLEIERQEEEENLAIEEIKKVFRFLHQKATEQGKDDLAKKISRVINLAPDDTFFSTGEETLLFIKECKEMLHLS